MLISVSKKTFNYTKVMTIPNSNSNLIQEEFPKSQSKLNNFSSLANDSLSLSILSSLLIDLPAEKQSISLFSDPQSNKEFSSFLEDRWHHYQSTFISNGAYSDSIGNMTVRRGVANFIENRDSHKSELSQIFVLNGSSTAFLTFITGMLAGKQEAVLLPSPLSFDYARQIKIVNGSMISYKAIENQEGSQLMGMKKALKEANLKGIRPKVLTVVNPGMVNGSLLSVQEIRGIIDLAHKENLVILVDEKSQEVVLGDKPFVSFKKVLSEHPNLEARKSVELISLHSISHSLTPSNMIGAYSELVNIDPEVYNQMLKLYSITLCGNCIGQIAVDLQVRREEYLESFSQNVRNLFDLEKEYNKKMLTQNFEDLRQVLEDSGKLELKGENNSFYSFYQMKSQQQNSMKLAREIEAIIGISAEPGETFGMPGYIRFDKFSEISDHKKNLLSELTKKLN